MFPSLCPSVALHPSDSVWPHVSQSTTMSVVRNRQAAWQPAFLAGPQHWQLWPSRTTSNVTHCWHFFNTHSLTPIACSFNTLHFHFLWGRLFHGKMDVRVFCSTCAMWCILCLYSFLHLGNCCSLCICFHTSLRICLNVTTQTCQLAML